MLAFSGYGVVVPHLRGHGTTRFLSDRTFLDGRRSAVAVDVLALMDDHGIPSSPATAGGAYGQPHRSALAGVVMILPSLGAITGAHAVRHPAVAAQPDARPGAHGRGPG